MGRGTKLCSSKQAHTRKSLDSAAHVPAREQASIRTHRSQLTHLSPWPGSRTANEGATKQGRDASLSCQAPLRKRDEKVEDSKQQPAIGWECAVFAPAVWTLPVVRSVLPAGCVAETSAQFECVACATPFSLIPAAVISTPRPAESMGRGMHWCLAERESFFAHDEAQTPFARPLRSESPGAEGVHARRT